MAKFGRIDAKARLMTVGSLVAVITVLGAASVSVAAGPAARTGTACHAPRLTGLALAVARPRAKHAGCALRVRGAKLEEASIQTVERQSPAAGSRASRVTVWLNPLCSGSAAYGPGINEPTVTVGPTELLSGFYLSGGPSRSYSAPGCKRPEPKSGAGTVEVTGASGVVVASMTSTRGQLVKIPLPPGSYTIRGTFLDAEINGVHPTETESVVIPAGHTVRQDFSLSVP
jgi:hypothetical protein